MFSLRFDMRNGSAEHYRAALDMAEWADDHGGLALVVSEHHGSRDGYLPVPLTLAAAMAARTKRIPIQVAALIVPLHDPVELAESMAVIDLLSGGRVSYVCATGYRASEYEMFGRSMRDRGHRLEEAIGVMRRAWTGEPFAYDGRRCEVTPRPATAGGPMLLLGGGSAATVRRAVRLGLGMITERSAGLAQMYAEECARAGVRPQFFLEAPNESITAAFIAEDPDRLWAEIGPRLLHDATVYHRWNAEAGRRLPASVTDAGTVDDLRRRGWPYRIFTPDEAVDHVRTVGHLALHPLCGGIDPDVAWSSLELLDRVVGRVAGSVDGAPLRRDRR